MSTEVVRAAFEAVGYTVEIRFYPWKRAVELARTDETVDGFFPEYVSSARSRDFLYSDSIGASPLGLVEPVKHPVRWETLNDLSGLVIGTVQGYINTTEFDLMVEDGILQVDTSVSDLFNLRKVMAGRVDLAVADVNVFRYLVRLDEHLQDKDRALRINQHLLGINDLFVCFRQSDRGQRLLEDFNRGLAQVSSQVMQQLYLDNHFPDEK